MYGRDRIRQQQEEDERLARQLQEEEERAAGAQPQNDRTSIRDLQEALDYAYARLLSAQDDRRYTQADLDNLQRECNTAQAKLSDAQARNRIDNARPFIPNLQNDAGSYRQINNRLEAQQPFIRPQAPAASQQIQAEPLRIFTPEELAKIRAHYNDPNKVSEHLHKLIDAALNDDEISLDLINNPVFIRGEVRIYDKAVVKSMLGANGEAKCPTNNNKTFRESDLIPCNTLIKAMAQLLNIIENKEYASPMKYSDILFANAANRSRANLSAEVINLVELYYNRELLERQKALFDIICRDPVTGVIMDDPVYLPDGYVYDRSTIAFCKRLAGPNKSEYSCPGSDTLKFRDEDVTPCYFVKSVLEQLKKNVLAMQEMMRRAAMQQNAEAPPLPLAPAPQPRS